MRRSSIRTAGTTRGRRVANSLARRIRTKSQYKIFPRILGGNVSHPGLPLGRSSRGRGHDGEGAPRGVDWRLQHGDGGSVLVCISGGRLKVRAGEGTEQRSSAQG